MDKDWKPIKITMNENYDISIPVLGSANCTTEYTEVFKDYGEEQDIPDKDFTPHSFVINMTQII